MQSEARQAARGVEVGTKRTKGVAEGVGEGGREEVDLGHGGGHSLGRGWTGHLAREEHAPGRPGTGGAAALPQGGGGLGEALGRLAIEQTAAPAEQRGGREREGRGTPCTEGGGSILWRQRERQWW